VVWHFASALIEAARAIAESRPMKKKKYETPQPYAAETKDSRFAGTFEVLIPVEGRNKPLRAPRQFDTLQAAEAWLHSPDGKDQIAELIEEDAKVRAK
jgi:antibiotic biosynthesis monooxygenase (ABM) superfamily enzyme